MKDSPGYEKAELGTWPKESHRLFRALQCAAGNSESDLLSGTALYYTAVCI